MQVLFNMASSQNQVVLDTQDMASRAPIADVHENQLPKVGDMVDVLWETSPSSQWYTGKLTRRSVKTHFRFNISYEDGDQQQQDLNNHTWRFTRRPEREFEPGDIEELKRETKQRAYKGRRSNVPRVKAEIKKVRPRRGRSLKSPKKTNINPHESIPDMEIMDQTSGESLSASNCAPGTHTKEVDELWSPVSAIQDIVSTDNLSNINLGTPPTIETVASPRIVEHGQDHHLPLRKRNSHRLFKLL